MEAIWPNVNVGDDSLFQCVREIRAALSDDQRHLIKLVSGRGYLFKAEVLTDPLSAAPLLAAAAVGVPAAVPAKSWRRFGLGGPTALAAVAVPGTAFGLAITAPMFRIFSNKDSRPLP
jgi:hypothetical protein